MATELLINQDIFDKISNMVGKEIGINLSSKKRYLVQTRLSNRVRELGLDSFEHYYYYLLQNKAEQYRLYNLLTTNVTSFFREPHHFDFLYKEVLPGLKKRQKRIGVRAWSAGCSTGEEPYSLAIILKEFFPDKDTDIKILATDINTEVLQTARQGIYRQFQLKEISAELLKKYFLLGQAENNGLFKVKDCLQEVIAFQRLNLNQDQYSLKTRLDFIFCRNVFIYFDRELRKNIMDKFYQHLKPGGYLFLGHSETLVKDQEQQLKWKYVGKTTYQKR